MHLQDHLRADALLAEPAAHADHGDLHDVGGASLNRSVHGISLGQAAGHGVARGDVVQVAAEDRRNIAVALSLFHHPVHVLLDVGVRGEITLYNLFGLLAGNVEPLAQAESRNTVDNAEIGGLGLAAFVAVHLGHLFAEKPCGGGRMHVLAVFESRDQRLVAAQVSHQAQFHLAVIGRKQQVLIVRRDERLPDPASQLVPHGNILQVGIGRGEPSGSCHGLVEGSMDLARRRIDQQRQCLHIGRK